MRIEVSFSSLYPPWPKMCKITNHINFSIQNKLEISLSLSLSLSQKWKFSLFFLSLAKRIFSLYKITPWLLNFLYIKILSLSRKLQKKWEKRGGGLGHRRWRWWEELPREKRKGLPSHRAHYTLMCMKYIK